MAATGMKAIVNDRYSSLPSLDLQEIDKPVRADNSSYSYSVVLLPL
jgi:hypothetical protein